MQADFVRALLLLTVAAASLGCAPSGPTPWCLPAGPICCTPSGDCSAYVGEDVLPACVTWSGDGQPQLAGEPVCAFEHGERPHCSEGAPVCVTILEGS